MLVAEKKEKKQINRNHGCIKCWHTMSQKESLWKNVATSVQCMMNTLTGIQTRSAATQLHQVFFFVGHTVILASWILSFFSHNHSILPFHFFFH